MSVRSAENDWEGKIYRDNADFPKSLVDYLNSNVVRDNKFSFRKITTGEYFISNEDESFTILFRIWHIEREKFSIGVVTRGRLEDKKSLEKSFFYNFKKENYVDAKLRERQEKIRIKCLRFLKEYNAIFDN